MEKIEKHLYRRQYQTNGGNWSTLYYGIFTDWQGKRRTLPLGSDLKAAKDGLALRLADNIKRVDFDAEKRKLEEAKIKALALGEYIDNTYLTMMKDQRSYRTKAIHCNTLKRLLGHHPWRKSPRAGSWNTRSAGKPSRSCATASRLKIPQ